MGNYFLDIKYDRLKIFTRDYPAVATVMSHSFTSLLVGRQLRPLPSDLFLFLFHEKELFLDGYR